MTRRTRFLRGTEEHQRRRASSVTCPRFYVLPKKAEMAAPKAKIVGSVHGERAEGGPPCEAEAAITSVTAWAARPPLR